MLLGHLLPGCGRPVAEQAETRGLFHHLLEFPLLFSNLNQAQYRRCPGQVVLHHESLLWADCPGSPRFA